MFLRKFKKLKLAILLTLSIMPTSILAYSEYIIPGGENIGIELNSKGVMIIGLYKIENSYPGKDANLKVGDVITSINDENISTIDELVKTINTSSDTVKLEYTRDNKKLETNLRLTKDENGVCKTGLYVKDSISGIGTLSFIDPNTKLFGALGHEIIEKSTGEILEIKDGKIFTSDVTSIDRSENGVPGEKNAKLNQNEITGDVFENTNKGIFGTYTETLPNKKTYKVAKPEEIKTGSATILTVLSGTKIKEYKIEINKINDNNEDTKNLKFTITDNELLKQTGGIIQGMSGSPIIQNDKIIAVVTHVVVNNPTQGYAIFITKMLEEAESK